MSDLAALPLAFFAGLGASIGPCLAPRFVAVAACATAEPNHGGRIAVTFLGGLVCAYACLGYAVGWAVGLIGLSAWTYAIVAASLTVAALAGLIRARVTACEQHQQARQSRSTGGIFLLGASSVMVFSPCCTPLVSAIGTSAGAFGGPLSAAGLLAVYGLGHGLPAALLALGVGSLAAPLRALALHQASAIAGNAILLVLAGYYWCLV